MGLIVGFGISVVSGLFTAAWGAYKDAPLEGFHRRSFGRSVLFSLVIFTIAAATMPGRVEMLFGFQLFFLVMGVERIAIEIYKPCFRREDQGKYLIPQDGSFLGYHVDSGWVLRVVGVAAFGVVFALMCIGGDVVTYDEHAVVAVTVGLFICCGGAAKDAPYEGFQSEKFLRSAIVLGFASPFLWLLGPTPLGLEIFIAGGIERLLVESYKTYFTDKRPGKFRPDLPIVDHRFLRRRPPLKAMAFAIVVAVAALYAHALVVRFA